MLIDAVVLAGGRSSRLGSVAKASLHIDGRSLLELAVSAALGVSRRCVVVGPIEAAELDHVEVGNSVPRNSVLVTREDPPFSGPAAALEAGIRKLADAGTPPSDAVLVLACDMPAIERQLPALVATLAAAKGDVDGALSVDNTGRRQPLASLYRNRALVDALSRFSPRELVGRSMRDLIEPLNLLPVSELHSATERHSATDDVDTWEDAARWGATIPTRETKEGAR